MTKSPPPDQQAAALHAVIAARLAPLPMQPGPDLRQRLFARVQHSRQACASFVTVRRGDTPWSNWKDGVRWRELRHGPSLRTRLIALRAGATLPRLTDAHAQEILVLQGALATPQPLGPQSFCLRTRADRIAWGVPQPTLLYVRERHGSGSVLANAAEAGWWPGDDAPTLIKPASRQGWLPFSPGVSIQPLHGDETALSLLARFEPGARVASHEHPLDEDCIMLAGDLYLGDTLLREHEYQLAPQGTRHGELMSEHGALLYFHGALDAALRTG